MDYKATLNLPQTSFPMKANLPQREPETLARWERERLYERIQEAGQGKPLYVLHDGPPYANGRIHIGHALNKILKDIIIKAKTMEGCRAPYVPGWDCHGLPIEHQVLKELGDKKKTLSTIEIRKLCREYAEKFFKIQREEFQRLGVLGDWTNPYLTMTPGYEASILREFGKFVQAGGVYKGKKPVLWCPTDETALAEAEVEYENHTSPSIYVKFPLEDSLDKLAGQFGITLPSGVARAAIVIWTTTPWTLPANQAVCLHPDFDYAFVKVGDEIFVIAEKLVDAFVKACGLTGHSILGSGSKGSRLEGLRCRRPLTDGLSPILLGHFVTLDQGTGCVHIAPGHGQEDYELSLKNSSLKVFAPVDSRGRFTDEVPEFQGLKVFEANPRINEKLKERGLLLGEGKLDHSYPHCWRCKHPVIFRATDQWFVSMEANELRKKALDEIDHRVQWIPKWGRDRIFGMVENRPDWCLSRQRVWGVPIPGFSCRKCGDVLFSAELVEHVAKLVEKEGADVWFARESADLMPAGTACRKCGSQDFDKEKDILDVWFESGVSHAAVLKPRGKAAGQEWWPADLYLEGSDQHRGWFHSALLAGVTTDGRAPYKAVLTHGFVVDGEGRKMSKSAGNVVAPQEVIKQYGAEILRLWVAAQDYREDIRISPAILAHLVDAYRKIRNTVRFLLSNLADYDPKRDAPSDDTLSELDRWALMRLHDLIGRVRRGYADCEFHLIIHALNNFCSVDMSAIYLDVLKDRLYTFRKDSPARRAGQRVLHETVLALTKLMAPLLTFTAEEIWDSLPESQREAPSVHLAAFPQADPRYKNAELEQRWDRLLKVRGSVQAELEIKRREKMIGAPLEAKVVLQADPEMYGFLQSYEHDLPGLFIVSQVELKKVDHLPHDPGFAVDVVKADGTKCVRCWNYRPSVGATAAHSELCDRCVEAVA
ncbi:MAG: isoleucine--tRNA ligase [Nitrospirales bacterium]|nr:isoleucine--tRNA ligase [Nitrospirales bacterium]